MDIVPLSRQTLPAVSDAPAPASRPAVLNAPALTSRPAVLNAPALTSRPAVLNAPALTSRPALERLFSANKTVGGCWCTWFMRSNAELREDWGEGNRKVLQAKVFADEPLGLLAIEGDQPKGWVAVAPRPAYSRLGRSKVTASEGGAETWSVTCFFVRRDARRAGLTGRLLAAAVDYAAEHGAGAVEAFPVDTKGDKRPVADLYHGTLSTFVDAGFTVIEQRGTSRTLVRKETR